MTHPSHVTSRSRMPQILLFSCIVFFIFTQSAYAQQYTPTENIINPCPFATEPPLSEFSLWSNPQSWPNNIVPGIGTSKGVNVTIPCQKAIMLDVPNLELGLLNVKGYLKFLDNLSVGSIYLKANYILVEGYLTIGSASQQFSNQVTIELTPNTKRANLAFTSFPASANEPRILGHKAFAVVGGQVSLHGLPGIRDMIVWCKLIENAPAGTKSIILDSYVSWPIGSQIVIASTDFDLRQSESFTIVNVMSTAKGTMLTLDLPLKFVHYGDPYGLSDGFGGFLDQRAEVALLSRNIVIKGTKETAYPLEGGHFMIFQTQTPQYIEGVSFRELGQQGVVGRYPVHFHFHGSQNNFDSTYFLKNSITGSFQRCVVLHGTSNLTIGYNVAFDNFGHCYHLEDGGESGNTFIGNIGITTKKVTKLLPDSTDVFPSVFWLSNPKNNLINNVAVGSQDSGIWYEMLSNVQGLSFSMPAFRRVNPQTTVLGTVYGNTIHSCMTGVKTYPKGMHPMINKKIIPMTMEKFNIYKNSFKGIFAKHLEMLTISNSTFADNGINVEFDFAQGCSVQNCLFVGASDNFGNSFSCNKVPRTTCRPVYTCADKITGQIVRNIGYNPKNHIFKGVNLQISKKSEDGTLPNAIISSRFSKFNDTCYKSAAISLVTDGQGEYWNSAHSVRNLQFSDDTNRLWFDNRVQASDDVEAFLGLQTQYFNLWDKDGSLMNSPGYVVANNPNILPVDSSKCVKVPGWNAIGCPNTCYRTINVKFIEPAFVPNGKAKLGDFSSILISRVSDGRVFQVDGNYLQTRPVASAPSNTRFFYFNVLAGETYDIIIKSPKNNPMFMPDGMVIRYSDGVGCGSGLVFRVPARKDQQYQPVNSGVVLFKPWSGGASDDSDSDKVLYQYTCVQNTSIMNLKLGAKFSNSLKFVSTKNPTSC